MAKDIDFFQNIVISKFEKMPLWVRVFTYLVAFLVIVYWTLCPSFIHGEVTTPGIHGGQKPYLGTISVNYDGQGINFPVTDQGTFIVPVFSKLPTPLELKVMRGEEAFPVYVNVFRRLTPGPIRIYGRQEPVSFSLTPFDAEPPDAADDFASAVETFLSRIGVGGEVFAQGNQAQVPSEATTETSVEMIVQQARQAAGQRQARHATAVSADPVELSLVVGALEDRYDIAIPSYDWQKLLSVQDIEAYIRNSGFKLRLRKLLRDAKEEELYLAPTIPSAKLRNAREAAQVPSSEEVVGLLDVTLLGSAKESMVFGTRGIYFRTSFTRGEGPRVGRLTYEQFAGRDFERCGFYEMSLGRDPAGNEDLRFVTAKTTMKATDLAALLSRIRDAYTRP